MADTITIDDFIKKYKLRMRAEQVDINPFMISNAKWEATHWKCTILHGLERDSQIFHYSMGLAHKGPPKLRDLLDCLAMDARTSDQTFEEWCSELGWDIDSRKAYRCWEQCREIARQLKSLVGQDGLEELVYKVERL